MTGTYGKPNCGRCGHSPFNHEVEINRRSVVDDDRFPSLYAWLRGCMLCSCGGYVPDRLPRVTELLGFDVRRIVS